MEIRDTAALVTGASRGLGKEVARQLSKAGARVVMAARSSAGETGELGAAVRELRAEEGNVHGLAFDVADKDSVHPMLGAAAALVGPIDILVHCASTLGPLPMPLLVDMECEDFERVLAVNLLGVFRLTKAVASSMVLRERGVVLFASSDAAVTAYERWGAYGVSKAAQDHLARSFAAELGSSGVRFLSVDPGEMDTKMHSDAMPEADRSTLLYPSVVAARFVHIVRNTEAIPNGSRLLAADFAQTAQAVR